MKLRTINKAGSRLQRVACLVFLGSLFLLTSYGQTNREIKPDEAAIRKRIAAIMSDRLKEGFVFPKSGTPGSPVYTRVPPSREAVNEIKGYGDDAVPVLSGYLQSKNEGERDIAVEFIGLLGGQRIVAPLSRVMKRDPSPTIRLKALRWLAQAPRESMLPIVRQAAKADADEKVREAALEILSHYPAT